MQDESVAAIGEGAPKRAARILGRMAKKGVGQGKGGRPKTKTGKDNSSRNATKHGLCSSRVVILPDEEQSEYEAVQRGWREEFVPEGYAEEKLVGELISADWALIRAGRRLAWAENAAVEEWTEESKHHLELMQRYKTAAERSFYRAWNAVQGLRKERLRMFEKEQKVAERLRELQADIQFLKKKNEAVEALFQGRCSKALKANKGTTPEQCLETRVEDGKARTREGGGVGIQRMSVDP